MQKQLDQDKTNPAQATGHQAAKQRQKQNKGRSDKQQHAAEKNPAVKKSQPPDGDSQGGVGSQGGM